MSRIGCMPVILPAGVSVSVVGNLVVVKGQKGSVSIKLDSGLRCSIVEGVLSVENVSSRGSLHGTCRSNIKNAVLGVSSGILIEVSVVGVGYRVEILGEFLVMYLGFSHDIRFKIPKGISISCPKVDRMIVEGCDIRLVSFVADRLSRFKKYDPYKGKGVIIKRSSGGFLLRKEASKKK